MAPGPAQLAIRPRGTVKIGIVCPYDLGLPGGVQQLCLELSDRLREGGEEVVVIGPGAPPSGRSGSDSNIVGLGRSVTIPANRSKVPLTLSPRSWARLHAALADADVVHIHEPLVPLAGWAALRSPKPKVVTFHADPPGWVPPLYRSMPLARVFRRTTLTAVSDSARKALPKAWGPVEIIPNAIDVAAYDLPVERLEQRIAFLGRDEPRKGLDIALEAFSLVRRDHPQAELVVMGADRPRSIPGVVFMGRVTDGEKHRTLASSSIYLAPNTGGESFGIVLAEAMAAGCAVIASDLDSFRAVLGETGILFPTGDAQALAESISHLLSDQRDRAALSAAGRAAVGRFDWSNVVGDYRSAYASAVSNR